MALPSTTFREIICGNSQSLPAVSHDFNVLGFEPDQMVDLFTRWKPAELARHDSFQLACKDDPKFTGVRGLFDYSWNGQCVGRFEARQSDSVYPEDKDEKRSRAEIKELYTAPFGEEVWYSFATYIPPDFPIENNRTKPLKN